MMGEMGRINQDMEERQQRIEKMQAETGAMLAHLARLKADRIYGKSCMTW